MFPLFRDGQAVWWQLAFTPLPTLAGWNRREDLDSATTAKTGTPYVLLGKAWQVPFQKALGMGHNAAVNRHCNLKKRRRQESFNIWSVSVHRDACYGAWNKPSISGCFSETSWVKKKEGKSLKKVSLFSSVAKYAVNFLPAWADFHCAWQCWTRSSDKATLYSLSYVIDKDYYYQDIQSKFSAPA